MGQLKEAFRDPKWIAIGFTVLVLVGSTIKFLRTLNAEPEVEAEQAAAIDQENVDVEPGTYRIAAASWNQPVTTSKAEAPNSQATGQAGAAPEDIGAMSMSIRTEAEKKFYQNAHKTWNGICIAVQQR